MKQTNGSRPLVDIQHVVKEFPVTRGAFLRHRVGTVKAISDVTLAIRPGETFGLVGESGCGKTTLGRLVVALEKPDSGQIWPVVRPQTKMPRVGPQRQLDNGPRTCRHGSPAPAPGCSSAAPAD